MNHSAEETLALLAKDLFNKRQRLLALSQASIELFDERGAAELEAEYRMAEQEYQQAKAAFARAMKTSAQAA